jgi:hypothetical protein
MSDPLIIVCISFGIFALFIIGFFAQRAIVRREFRRFVSRPWRDEQAKKESEPYMSFGSSPLSAGPPSGKQKYVIRYHVGATSAHTVVFANTAADAVRWFQPYNHYGMIDEVYPAKESE